MSRTEIFVANFHLRISARVCCVSRLMHIVVILWNQSHAKILHRRKSRTYICECTHDICEMPVIIAGILQGEISDYILSDITLPAHTQHMASVT